MVKNFLGAIVQYLEPSQCMYVVLMEHFEPLQKELYSHILSLCQGALRHLLYRFLWKDREKGAGSIQLLVLEPRFFRTRFVPEACWCRLPVLKDWRTGGLKDSMLDDWRTISATAPGQLCYSAPRAQQSRPRQVGSHGKNEILFLPSCL